jgi:predicted esterase
VLFRSYEHTYRKYPLVIGDTQFGVAMRGAHGRLWIPAVAACDAYVIVVNREDWWRGLEQWSDNVRAVYNEAIKTLPIDKTQVFLFGASAETTHMTPLITNSPALWKGVMFLNPTGLPDFSSAPPAQSRPRILISAGGLERSESRLKKYQDQALPWGVTVEYLIHPGEGHHLVGNVSQVERTKAMIRFIFDD